MAAVSERGASLVVAQWEKNAHRGRAPPACPARAPAGAPDGCLELSAELWAVAADAVQPAVPLLAACGAAPRRVALVRAAFLADGAALPPLAAVLRPLGHRVVAVAAAALQQPHEARLVDEWLLEGGDAAPRQTAEGVSLPLYLTQRGFLVRCAADVAAAPAAVSGVAQSCNRVLMVAPTAFESNAQAAADNAFMACDAGARGDAVRAAVLAEHAGLHATLTAAGVRVRLFAHAAAHGTPDACFPNNWFSLCHGALVLYPMKCANRAAERRDDIVRWLAAQPGAARRVDLTGAEAATPPAALEGTGCLVLDHALRVAYVARSERTDDALALRAARELGFPEVHAFDATDAAGRAVYHTNVVMSVGTGFAVVCDEAVADAAQRAALLAALARGGREVLRITRAQMGAMCGNVLELRRGDGAPVLALSQQAHDAFTAAQRDALRAHVAALLPARLDTLERVGGGSVRCCLGELFDV